MNYRLSGVVFASVLLIGCASSGDRAQEGRSDPLEGFNRTMFNFNYDVLDPYLSVRSWLPGAIMCRSQRAMGWGTSSVTWKSLRQW